MSKIYNATIKKLIIHITPNFFKISEPFMTMSVHLFPLNYALHKHKWETESKKNIINRNIYDIYFLLHRGGIKGSKSH